MITGRLTAAMAVTINIQFYLLPLTFAMLFVTAAEHFKQPSPWWAKPITDDLSTAGCLTKSQIQQVKDAGFKSLISMFNSESGEEIGDQKYPSSSEEEGLARELGLEYRVILKPDEYDWMTLSTLTRFSEVYPNLPKPVLFHCMSAYSASFISLLHLVNSTRHQRSPVPLDPTGLKIQTAAMGFDYSMDDAPLQMLREVSGEKDLELDINPSISNPYWNFGYWPLKPITKNWYFLGQLRPKQLKLLQENGIDMILRVQANHNGGESSAPPATSGKRPEVRDTPVPDPRRMACPDVTDDVSLYDAQGEKEEAEKLGLRYLTVSVDTLDASRWRQIRSQILEEGNKHSGILVHGKDTQNTVLLGLLAAGCQHGYNSTWAVDAARRHGYIFTQEEDSSGATSFILQSAGDILDTIGAWSPTVASLLTPVAESLGLYQVRPAGGQQAGPIALLRAILDHRDDMCR